MFSTQHDRANEASNTSISTEVDNASKVNEAREQKIKQINKLLHENAKDTRRVVELFNQNFKIDSPKTVNLDKALAPFLEIFQAKGETVDSIHKKILDNSLTKRELKAMGVEKLKDRIQIFKLCSETPLAVKEKSKAAE